MNIKSTSILALALISCNDEIAPVNEPSPVGEWVRQDKFLEAGFADSSTIKYSLALGSDGAASWKMYWNDSLKKNVQGTWTLSHDDLPPSLWPR